MRLHSSRLHAQCWPFWGLLAAWLCVTLPSSAICLGLLWMKESRSFSHQQRLTNEVAFLLVGEEAPGLVAQVRTLPAQAPELPVLPVDAFGKQSELLCETMMELSGTASRLDKSPVWKMAGLDLLQSPPPHGPPRGRIAA